MAHEVWVCPPAWRGETAFILGGGPSLHPSDVDRLRGRRVIPINNAWRLAPWSELMFAADARWFRWYGTEVTSFPGRIVTVAPAVATRARVSVMEKTGDAGIESNPSGLRGQWTGLHYALNLAAHLGVARSVLLGFDMELAPNGRTHWHAGHPAAAKPENYDKMIADLATTVEPLAALGMEVINATPGGRLDLWPRRSLGEVLAADADSLLPDQAGSALPA